MFWKIIPAKTIRIESFFFSLGRQKSPLLSRIAKILEPVVVAQDLDDYPN